MIVLFLIHCSLIWSQFSVSGMDVVKKIESFGSAPKGIVSKKIVVVDCGELE